MQKCEDCGEKIPKNKRRYRCLKCKLLICSWCAGHVHTTKVNVKNGYGRL